MPDFVSKRLLVIDDEESITSMLKLGLERRGYLVDASNDPKKAVAEFESGKYSVLIADIRMPGMNGFEMAARLWQKDRNLRICFLSAFDLSLDERESALSDMHIEAVLRKPITFSELTKALDGIFSKAPKIT